MADESFEDMIAEIVDGERPIHPTLAPYAQPGEVDPTARPLDQAPHRTISARERTITSIVSQHAIERLTATLTPLGMIVVIDALLGFLSPTDEELEHGYEGITVDPWGEVAQLHEDIRDEIRRAAWHFGWAIEALGTGQTVEAVRTAAQEEASH